MQGWCPKEPTFRNTALELQALICRTAFTAGSSLPGRTELCPDANLVTLNQSPVSQGLIICICEMGWPDSMIIQATFIFNRL